MHRKMVLLQQSLSCFGLQCSKPEQVFAVMVYHKIDSAIA